MVRIALPGLGLALPHAGRREGRRGVRGPGQTHPQAAAEAKQTGSGEDHRGCGVAGPEGQ